MITKFKIYENDTLIEPKFKIGDFVYCVKPCDELKEDIKYKVIDVHIFHDCVRICVSSENTFNHWSQKRQWLEYRFISEIEYNANKYNI